MSKATTEAVRTMLAQGLQGAPAPAQIPAMLEEWDRVLGAMPEENLRAAISAWSTQNPSRWPSPEEIRDPAANEDQALRLEARELHAKTLAKEAGNTHCSWCFQPAPEHVFQCPIKALNWIADGAPRDQVPPGHGVVGHG